MVRLATVFFSFVIFSQSARAETPAGTDPRIATAFAIQSAMAKAKEHLQANRPGDAVKVLEAAIQFVNGNPSFLLLMKEAYIAQLKELRRTQADPDRIDHVCKQLRTLDPTLKPDEVAAPAAIEKPANIDKPAVIDKPAEPVAQAKSEAEDPFQQAPVDRSSVAGGVKNQARAQFEQKHYAEAAALFAQAHQTGEALGPDEKQAWGYCRLSTVVKRLGDAKLPKSSMADLEKESEEAMKIGGTSLEKFGQQVLAEIHKRGGAGKATATAIPAGWQTIETGSFRIFFQQARPQAEQIGKAAEQCRTATYEKWVGPVGGDWSPRCDLWLHATAADYAKATTKPAATPGHASIGLRDGRVMARRLDLRLDDAGLMEITMPREVAYVVVTDLFPEQPVPRWADVGMTILSEPQGEVSRYRRAVPKLLNEKKLFAMHDLLKMSDFPEAEKITAFYVESVSLVDFLVTMRGPKAFALYLREAPRRGYEEALKRHYGFKDAKELQESWMKFALNGE